ncbi:beta-1,6-N-acetylglucosaminyltransferase [Rhodobacter capsulatus]|uniref:Peptide O-xylosyltransferase n=1 Tax=Rhodobacter capsulatus TaxID=1061 RepID=A0A1G7EPQ7_RHOCA|nr:beta-1,6-N-acetylglucosaminyltransferase [Rhodobacter capsulatus]WER09517.1 beta-1,6-N-acetylglucosaminyltransferase [Rhodobacter capsulatus]SDE65609.1 Core-2/I-Branching enzyme [Rhodobacter capsulatus]
MTVGFIMMCHTALDRAAQVARYWASHGAPVVVHVDARVPAQDFDALGRALADLDSVSFCTRFKCDWGTWSLVQAAQTGATQLLARHPEVGHVFLASGACLPLRPLHELADYLTARPNTDFIESVTTAEVGWTVGGIDMERFTLRFPFSWKKRRRLFDAYVDFQRRIGFKRKIPGGIVPHLGSQWWCLSRPTLTAILQAPDRPQHDRYFKRVWIPDESYFQSLARIYATNIESRSLTLSKFDYQGKPHIFYDDHLQLLRRSDCFVARKIWPKAEKLYATFLSDRPAESLAEPNPSKIDRLFSKAVERRTRGRPGLYMQSRFPRQDHENGKTSAQYSILQGFSDLFENFEGWLAKYVGARVHGHLFGPDRAAFSGGETMFNGCLSDSAALRDYNPRGFLTNLIWNGRGERQCFMFSPRDTQDINWFTATDPNAQISVISGAWAVPLFHSQMDFSEIRREAARLQQIEIEHLNILRSMYVKARVRIWTMAEFIENPMEPLQMIIDEISPRATRRLTEAPQMIDLTGFGQFLQNLKNQGMQPRLMGDFPVAGDTVPPPRRRPYLVK